MASTERLCITVVYAPQSRAVLECTLRLEAGSTVRDAILATGWQRLPEVQSLLAPTTGALPLHCGIWGKPCALTQGLHDGDRVELYRPLLVDPKVARRERFARQGSRTAGLFAHRRGTPRT